LKEKIDTPYSLAPREKQIIKDNFVTHTDWKKEIFNDIKNNILKHLRTQQDNECCYCKRQLGYDIKDVDIEHIIPKSNFPKFTFNTKNLALSCPGCNTKKSTTCVLKRQHITNYPRNGTNIKIIHAHYDEYRTHIEILDDCIYIAKSKKGSETITICELFRLKTVEENARRFITGKSIISQLTEDLRTSKPNERQELLDLLRGD